MPLATAVTDWMQGIGTAVAAVAAVGALIAAGLAYLGQRTQLAQQAKELTALTQERGREAEERRRSQVCQVFVWWEAYNGGGTYRITNASRYPIYSVQMMLFRDGAVTEQQPPMPQVLPGDSIEADVRMSDSELRDFGSLQDRGGGHSD